MKCPHCHAIAEQRPEPKFQPGDKLGYTDWDHRLSYIVTIVKPRIIAGRVGYKVSFLARSRKTGEIQKYYKYVVEEDLFPPTNEYTEIAGY